MVIKRCAQSVKCYDDGREHKEQNHLSLSDANHLVLRLLCCILIQKSLTQIRRRHHARIPFAEPFVPIFRNPIVYNVSNRRRYHDKREQEPAPAVQVFEHMKCRRRFRVNRMMVYQYERIQIMLRQMKIG